MNERGIESLACAVLRRAILDAAGKSVTGDWPGRVRKQFQGEASEFLGWQGLEVRQFWCDVAGLEIDAFDRAVRTMSPLDKAVLAGSRERSR